MPTLQRHRRSTSQLVLLPLLAIALAATLLPDRASADPSPTTSTSDTATFELIDASIAEIQSAMESGTITSAELTQMYLDRIEAFDESGPALNSIIAVNPNALGDAAVLDGERRAGTVRGPLHGVPVLIKDNYDTYDMPTTNSSLSLEGSIPLQDSTQVELLREAGAVLIAKTNLHEFARGITTISSLGGQTLNAYVPARNPGGSSGGTGTGVAANFAAIGMGSDTCGSIRIPSAHNNLVGIRPTMGLSSRAGIIPLSSTHDVGGPMGRSVEDVAIVLDATVGVDPRDPVTEGSIGNVPDSYLDGLDEGAFEGTRIGVFSDLFGTDDEDLPVTTIVERAITEMEELGAEVVELGERPEILGIGNLIGQDFKFDLEDYLAGLGPDAPFRTLQEIYDSGLFHPSLENGFVSSLAVESRDTDEYRERLEEFELARETTLDLMEDEDIDAFVYPTIRREAQPVGESQPGSNCGWSAITGFPAISVPAGFTDTGLPVGVELLAGPYEEPKLLSLGYAYEQATDYRTPPTTAPDIHGTIVGPETTVCERFQGGASFPDAPGSGHREFIDCLAELGVVQGRTDGTFGPRDDVSREQLASFVVRAIELATGQVMDDDGPSYPDVGTGSTHGRAIAKLSAAGIVRGYEDGTFRPRDPVTRDQTARYIVNALELVLGEELPRSQAAFPDVAPGSQYASDIDALVTGGVVSGFSDGRFGPREPVTRAQMTRFVGQGLELLAGERAYRGP